MVRDNFLLQLVHSPTRESNILDLLLTNIPRKVRDVCAFEDILESDHQLIHFHLSFIIEKKGPVKRQVYNWKKVYLNGLKDTILHTPWDIAFKKHCTDTYTHLTCTYTRIYTSVCTDCIYTYVV